MNIVLALAFLGLGLLIPMEGLKLLTYYGVLINAYLGLFNLLPFFVFDGKKIFMWNRMVWLGLVLVSLLMINSAKLLV